MMDIDTPSLADIRSQRRALLQKCTGSQNSTRFQKLSSSTHVGLLDNF